MSADPKPAPRIKDPAAVQRKRRSDRTCRCGCGGAATDGHHLIPRSLRGDDVEANIIGMAHACHLDVEFAPDSSELRERVGAALREDEIRYVLAKRGDGGGREFLRRHYMVTDERLERAAGRRTQ